MNSIKFLRAKSDLYRELAGQMSDPWAGKSLREAVEAYEREADSLEAAVNDRNARKYH